MSTRKPTKAEIGAAVKRLCRAPVCAGCKKRGVYEERAYQRVKWCDRCTEIVVRAVLRATRKRA